MTTQTVTPLDALVADADALEQAVNLADAQPGSLELVQVANTATIARAATAQADLIRGLAALVGTRDRGPQGKPGRDAEIPVVVREAPAADGWCYHAEAFAGAADDDPKWLLRLHSVGLLTWRVKLPTEQGGLRWSSRSEYTYADSETASLIRRDRLKDRFRQHPDLLAAEMVDRGEAPEPDDVETFLWLGRAHPEFVAAVIDGADWRTMLAALRPALVEHLAKRRQAHP